MYKKQIISETSLDVNTSYEGETIEVKMRRITNNKEPIKDGAPLIFTERKNGVQPEYNIRTDRFEIAVDAMDKVSKTLVAKRANLTAIQGGDNTQKDGGAEPIQGTETK